MITDALIIATVANVSSLARQELIRSILSSPGDYYRRIKPQE